MDKDNICDYSSTPCVGVCSTGFDDVCRGCLRTADEVGRWVEMNPAEKRAVWVRILAEGYKPRRNRDDVAASTAIKRDDAA